MKKLLLAATTALALFVAPVTAGASETRKTHKFTDLGTLLSAVALNATAATRTLTVTQADLLGHGLLVVYIDYTNSSATTVTMVCSASDDSGTKEFTIQSCDVAAGNCTSSDNLFTNAVSGDEDFTWRVDVLGFIHVTCILGGASADGSDLVTVTGYTLSL